MSKKKNTLKDLDEFLKQQAASLVSPPRLSDKIEPKKTEPTPEEPKTEEAPVAESVRETAAPVATKEVSAQQILNDISALAEKEGARFKPKFYDLIIKAIEARKEFSAEDKMLINTALYLKNGDRWKDAIREYWRKHQP